ncbi:putative DNA primase/helicase [Bradyrhizobium diazoefficiens]|uniref:phage/plasmid primase, P4 family n=1 Tax=Bradyrhizobium diazoefficiens TaxID=1355477 RepID=UPI002729EAD1|nr:phage/plasmid primase, P4 family [Bradyrhizobium diazoefficiens]WLA64708.1 phage/plasmid primase, P4 family [Bradyrhizobium diazoefficiens]
MSSEKPNHRPIRLVKRALHYASKGLHVFPVHSVRDGRCSCRDGVVCANPGKHPMTSNGFKDATTDSRTIKKWWIANPDANIGIATGRISNLVVVDVDGQEGKESLAELIKTYGRLPKTPKVKTGRGLHYYLRPSNKPLRNSTGSLGNGVDIRADGGYVVAPGSVHRSGKFYRFLSGRDLDDIEIAKAPKWLMRSRSNPENHNAEVKGKDDTDIGSRNNSLTAIAGKLRRNGLSEAALLAALRAENKNLVPPLGKEEVKTIARSVAGYPVGKDQSDLAERVMKIVLDNDFGGGDHLIRCADERFWMYNGTHWEPAQESWLRGRTLAAIQAMPDRGAAATSAIIGQVATLLKASRAVNDDRLRFVEAPLPVINCLNGELWIDTGGNAQLREHQASSYLRHCLNVNYDPSAKCPEYDKAVKEIFSRAQPTAKGMVRHWNEVVGYMIQHRREIGAVIILKGGGSNGKTVLMQTALKLLGDNLVSAQRIESLESQFALGNLLGKLLLLDDDVKAGIRLPDGQLKKISEAKTVTGEHKHGPQFNFTIRSLPVLLCNNVPSLADVSHGMRRRLMVIPFDRTFTEEEKDDELFLSIWKDEMSGVLNRAIEGLQRVLNRGMRFKPPKAVRAAAEAWLAEANPLPAFIQECCAREPSESYLLADFYAAYTKWSQAKGYTRIQQSGSVARNLTSLGFSMKKRNRGQTILGLRAK